MLADEFADIGIDLFTPAAAIEDAIMAHLGLQVVAMLLRREIAAQIAVQTVTEGLKTPGTIAEVIFCCFSARDLAVYARWVE